MGYRRFSFMSSCLARRLESTIAADHDFLEQLCKSENQMHLDALYAHMLFACVDSERNKARKLLGAAVLLNGHSTPALLATLLELPPQEVITLLQTFVDARLLTTATPLDFITETTSLRLCHDSLRGFVVDPHRCPVKVYLVSPADYHEALLDRCLSLLNEHLRQDICEIRNPGLANADVPDLPARIGRSVTEALRYACVSWPVHLVGSSSLSGTVSAALLDFCAKHLLHWLEVLSLLGELMPAEGHLPKMIAWCQVNVLCVALMSSNQEQQHHFADLPLMQDIAELLRDVYRALQLYAYPMASHALQVYHSILATLPHCRLLDHTEKTQTVTPCLVSPRSSDWSSLVKVIEGHTGFVLTAAFSPNGAHIVSGSYDETIRVWDAVTGKQLGVLKGHTGWVFSVAFSPDGAHIVSGSADNTIRIWNAHTGKQLAVLKGHTNWVKSVAFVLDGARIVSGSLDDTVRVWDAHMGKQLAVLKGHTGWVFSVAFSPDGTHIASGSSDRTVRVWDALTGKQLAVHKGHANWVKSVAFSPDGTRVISGSLDKTVRVWDAHTGKQLAVLKGHTGWVFSVAFSPDGTHIASGSSDKTVREWDSHTGKQLAVLKGHTNWVKNVAFSPDGARIVSGALDNTVRIWDARTCKQFAVLECHTGWVRSVAFSPNRTHIVSGSDDETVRVWDAHTGKQLAVLKGHTYWVLSAALSSDGAHIVSGSGDGTVRVWDADLGKQLAVLEGHTGWVFSVAFSPDGAHIVSGSGDKTVRLWSAHTGKQLAVLEDHKDGVWSVAFSPDGKCITSQDIYGAELAWNLTSVLLHEQSHTHVVPPTLLDVHDFTSAEGLLAHLPPTPTGTLVWNEESGWISWQRSRTHSVRLCWLPHERRGYSFASHDMTAAIGARHGAVTILTFSEVIAMLDTVM
jgi:WD40 repeat protein